MPLTCRPFKVAQLTCPNRSISSTELIAFKCGRPARVACAWVWLTGENCTRQGSETAWYSSALPMAMPVQTGGECTEGESKLPLSIKPNNASETMPECTFKCRCDVSAPITSACNRPKPNCRVSPSLTSCATCFATALSAGLPVPGAMLNGGRAAWAQALMRETGTKGPRVRGSMGLMCARTIAPE